MNKQQIGATAYQYILIVIILAAIAYRGGRDFLFKNNNEEVTVTLENIQEIYPAAAYYDQNRLGTFDVYGNNSNRIGSVLLSSEYSRQFGYAGNVPLLIGVDDNLTITKITLLPNHETEYYIEAIYGKKFIGKWQGVKLDDAMQFHVDVISGATHTCNAVIAGVRQAASSVVGYDESVVTEINHWATIKNILLLSLILLSLVMAYKKGTARYRTIYMVLVLVIMGLILNNALSVSTLYGWLQKGFVWRANWQGSVIFILALAISFVGKRKFYCNYLCPMGALQELTNRYTPFKKRKFPTQLAGITSREIYLTLIAGALLTGFTPELSHLEPFMFFSFRIIGIGLIIFGLMVILLSLFFSKPWCSVCPTGCLLDTMSYTKAKNLLFLKHKIMQKSRFLNIVLAAAVLVLTILLTTKENGSKNSGAGTAFAAENVQLTSSDTSTVPFQKKSVGVKSYLYPQPAMVIGSYDKEGKPNMMTAAWIGICNSDPLSISVSLRPATYSYGNITETKSFTVNIPSAQLAKYVSYAGRFSGRDVDKFKETGLTPLRGEFVNAPYIKEFPIIIECEVTAIHELGSHRQFIGKVIDVKADKAILDAKGNVDLNLLNPIIYAGGSFYETGSLIPRSDRSADNIDGKPFVPDYNQRYMNKTLEVIHKRKSVRHFTDQPVTKEQIKTLLRAGMAAPTAVNRQPWAFYVITQRETLDILSEKLPYAKMLTQVQAAIVVCGDMEKAGTLKDLGYWVQDCSAASQNILLAAESMGLGAVWTAAYPYDDRAKAVIEELNLPETHIPLNVIPIGYPSGEDLPKNKWNVDNVIWK